MAVNAGCDLTDDLLFANGHYHEVLWRLQIGRKPLNVDFFVENIFGDVFKNRGGFSRESVRRDHFCQRSVNSKHDMRRRHTDRNRT